MAEGFFRAAGVVMLLFDVAFIAGSALMVWRYAALTDRTRMIIGYSGIALMFAMVGIGMLQRKRWAAVLFGALTLMYAILCLNEAVNGSIHPVPGRADWLGYPYAVFFSAPTLIVLKNWSKAFWR